MNFIKGLDKKILRPIVFVQKGVLILTSSLAILLLVVNTLDRFIFHIGLFGMEEMIIVFVMWLYWFAGMHASYEQSHIKGDVTNMFIKTKKGRMIVTLIAQAITVFVLYFWFQWALDYYEWVTGRGRSFTQGLRMPMLTSQLPLVIGFVMMFFYSIYHFGKTILSFVRKDYLKEDASKNAANAEATDMTEEEVNG